MMEPSPRATSPIEEQLEAAIRRATIEAKLTPVLAAAASRTRASSRFSMRSSSPALATGHRRDRGP